MKKYLFILFFVPVLCFGQVTVKKAVIGEYAQPELLSDSTVVIFSASLGLSGNGGAGTSGVPLIITSAQKFVDLGNTLHGSSFIDANGHVWWTGDNTDGEGGLGVSSGSSSLVQILVDSRGLAFNNINRVQGSYIQIGADALSGQYFVKNGTSSDTVFYAGVDKYGMGGSGNITQTTFLSPALQFGLASGKRIIAMTSEAVTVAILNDGTVQSWGAAGTTSFLGRSVSGNNYAQPMPVTGFDDSAIQVCGGNLNGIFVLTKTHTLYGWGPHAIYLGNAGDPAYTTPRNLTDSVTSYMIHGRAGVYITKIVCNSTCAHALLNNGEIWAFGDASESSIGNGQQSNLPSPCCGSTAWNIDPSAVAQVPVIHPVLMCNKTDWVDIFGGSLFGFTFQAIDANGVLWDCGRNKGSVIPNGVIECAGDGGDLSNFYPNSWDVPYITPQPWQSVTSSIQQTCPGCASGAVTANCHSCGTTTSVTSVAGSNQTINILSSILDGSASSCVGGKIVYYLWTQTGGPTSTIDAPASKVIHIKHTTTGVYTYNLFVQDQSTTHTSNSTVTITVNPSNSISIPAGSRIIAH